MRGVEPLTSALRTQRSAKLSYIPRMKASLKLKVPSFKFIKQTWNLEPEAWNSLLDRVAGQQRSFRIRDVGITILDLSDHPVKTNFLS